VALTLLGLAAAYLVGAIPVGLIVARLSGGGDLRRAGSGNIGATNVLRTLGRGPAIATLLGDVAKGALATALAAAAGEPGWAAPTGAVAAMVGNCWPVFLRFRGGKGMATGLGGFLVAAPVAVLPAAVAWLGVLALFRLVSLASLVAVVVLPAAAVLLGYPGATAWAALGAAAIVIVRHRQNLVRLRRGVEPRIGQRVG